MIIPIPTLPHRGSSSSPHVLTKILPMDNSITAVSDVNPHLMIMYRPERRPRCLTFRCRENETRNKCCVTDSFLAWRRSDLSITLKMRLEFSRNLARFFHPHGSPATFVLQLHLRWSPASSVSIPAVIQRPHLQYRGGP